MNNPIQFINMLKGIKNPKDAVINMIKTNNNPMIKNLVEMAEKATQKVLKTLQEMFLKNKAEILTKKWMN